MVDRCVVCGEIIPEGRMVCPDCEQAAILKELKQQETKKNAKTTKNKKAQIILKAERKRP